MSYEIFARKYRPWKFEEVIGQKAVVRTIQNAIDTGRVAQAYLFSGARGTGKTTVARILAKALNCVSGDHPTAHPCQDKENACQVCKAISEDKAIDVLEIDGASNRQVGDIEPIRETVKYKPVYTRTKVLIIDEVHMLSSHAFNALLKTLEEPPPNTVFIFATTEFHKVPPTIVSRCQHFEFKKISHKDIINHLMEIARKEGITITPAGLVRIAEASDGSMRDAQSLLDQARAFSGENISDDDLKIILGTIDQDVLFRFSSAVLDEKPARVFGLVEEVIAAGHELRNFFAKLIEHFRALLLVSSLESPEELLAANAEELQALRAQASKASAEDFLRYLLALQQGEGGLRYSAQPRIYLEAFLVKLCHFRRIVPLKELIQDIESLRAARGVPGPEEPRRGTSAPRTPGTPGAPLPPPDRSPGRGPNPVRPTGSNPPEPSPAGPKEGGLPRKDIFGQILERLAKDRPPLAAVLSQYSSVKVSGDLVEVLFERGKGFFATSIQEKDLRVVEKAASEVVGRQVSVRFTEENAPGTEAVQPGREMETAVKDPTVQFFVKTFKAQILSADPVRSSRDRGPKGPGEGGT